MLILNDFWSIGNVQGICAKQRKNPHEKCYLAAVIKQRLISFD